MDTKSIRNVIKVHSIVKEMCFNEFSLNSNVLMSRLHNQRMNSNYCDIKLIADTESAYGHKCVLAANSTYFDSLFKKLKRSVNEMDDKNNIIIDVLTVNTKHPDLLMVVLDYVYTGVITLTSDNIAQITALATQFHLTKLEEHCIDYLNHNLCKETCFHILALSHQHNLYKLQSCVEAFIYSQINFLLTSPSLLNLPINLFECFLRRSLPLNELMRLETMVKWIVHQSSSRKALLPILLKLISWKHLSADDITSFLNTNALVNADDWSLFHIFLSLNNSDMLPEKYANKFAELKLMLVKKVDDSEGGRENGDTVGVSSGDVGSEGEAGTGDNGQNVVFEDISDLDEDFETDVGLVRGGCVKEVTVLKRESERLALKDKKNYNQTKKKRKGVVKRVGGKENRRIEGQGVVLCSECPFKCRRMQRMMIHVKSSHATKNKSFTCPVCQFTCHWNKQYLKHLRTCHFPGPPHFCDQCGFHSNTIQALLLHRIDHSDSRPYPCNVCGLSFKLKHALQAHVRRHTGEKLYSCEDCGKSFGTKGTLKQHSVTHSDLRPFLCHLCGFETKYQSHLKSHSRTHTGDLFKCMYVGCTYKTPKRSQLACHQRRHTALKPHQCTLCGWKFREKSHLVRHLRIHNGDRPYCCDKCDYESCRADKLKEHYRKHHGEEKAGKMAYRPRPSRLLSKLHNVTKIDHSNHSNDKKASNKNKKDIRLNKKNKKSKSGLKVKTLIPVGRKNNSKTDVAHTHTHNNVTQTSNIIHTNNDVTHTNNNKAHHMVPIKTIPIQVVDDFNLSNTLICNLSSSLNNINNNKIKNNNNNINNNISSMGETNNIAMNDNADDNDKPFKLNTPTSTITNNNNNKNNNNSGGGGGMLDWSGLSSFLNHSSFMEHFINSSNHLLPTSNDAFLSNNNIDANDGGVAGNIDVVVSTNDNNDSFDNSFVSVHNDIICDSVVAINKNDVVTNNNLISNNNIMITLSDNNTNNSNIMNTIPSAANQNNIAINNVFLSCNDQQLFSNQQQNINNTCQQQHTHSQQNITHHHQQTYISVKTHFSPHHPPQQHSSTSWKSSSGVSNDFTTDFSTEDQTSSSDKQCYISPSTDLSSHFDSPTGSNKGSVGSLKKVGSVCGGKEAPFVLFSKSIQLSGNKCIGSFTNTKSNKKFISNCIKQNNAYQNDTSINPYNNNDDDDDVICVAVERPQGISSGMFHSSNNVFYSAPQSCSGDEPCSNINKDNSSSISQSKSLAPVKEALKKLIGAKKSSSSLPPSSAHNLKHTQMHFTNIPLTLSNVAPIKLPLSLLMPPSSSLPPPPSSSLPPPPSSDNQPDSSPPSPLVISSVINLSPQPSNHYA